MKQSLITAVAVVGAVAFAGEQLPNCSVVAGWQQAGPARSYAADTLYDYMNGNSEGYLIYGFRAMRGVTCVKGETKFVVDISEMPDPGSAWGLWAANRDTRLPVEQIGVTGQIAPQRGTFLKGSRFVEISASPAANDHSAALREFLKAMDAQLDGSTAPPPFHLWFPPAGLDSASLRVVPQSVLGLGMLKRGYIAEYDFARAFIVEQGTPEAASGAMTKLAARFGSVSPISGLGEEAFAGEDKYLGRLIFVKKGQRLAGFVKGKEGVALEPAARALAERLP